MKKNWKANPHYKPKFSLSIKYLKKILTKKELDDIMEKYIEAKLNNGK